MHNIVRHMYGFIDFVLPCIIAAYSLGKHGVFGIFTVVVLEFLQLVASKLIIQNRRFKRTLLKTILTSIGIIVGSVACSFPSFPTEVETAAIIMIIIIHAAGYLIIAELLKYHND